MGVLFVVPSIRIYIPPAVPVVYGLQQPFSRDIWANLVSGCGSHVDHRP
jgi:hypothetical protein